MAIARLTSKGQITIPKEIRDLLGIAPGDKLAFVVESDGKVVLPGDVRRVAAARIPETERRQTGHAGSNGKGDRRGGVARPEMIGLDSNLLVR